MRVRGTGWPGARLRRTGREWAVLLALCLAGCLLTACTGSRALQHSIGQAAARFVSSAGVGSPRSTERAEYDGGIASTPVAAPGRVATPSTSVGSAPPETTGSADSPDRLLIPIITGSDSLAPGLPGSASSSLRTRIEIVWPHGGAAVRDATQANVTVYVLAGEGNNPPPCASEPVVRLWAAQNAGPARMLKVGQKRMTSQGGNTFPVWDFNDIEVSAAQDPTGKLAFFATVDNLFTYHNVWMHAADPRTIFPQADIPTGTTDAPPSAVDARVEIVWPHGSAPVGQADLANITVYLFEAGSQVAIAASSTWSPVVRLHRSLNADPEEPGTTVVGVPRTMTQNGLSFRVWDFNDVAVSAARDPLNKIYFWASVDNVPASSNIWAHGLDARTIFPEPEILNSCR
jgi:hypothetical protein